MREKVSPRTYIFNNVYCNAFPLCVQSSRQYAMVMVDLIIEDDLLWHQQGGGIQHP